MATGELESVALRLVSGADGDILATIEATATDSDGYPVAGVEFAWSATGGATVEPAKTTADSRGHTTVTITRADSTTSPQPVVVRCLCTDSGIEDTMVITAA